MAAAEAAPVRLVAVTGAGGLVGRFVVAALERHGIEVRALHREDPLGSALVGVDAAVHCAFSHLPGRYRGGEGDDITGFWQRNLGATLDLLQNAREQALARVVLLSSRAVFGTAPAAAPRSEPLHDQAPCYPDTHYGGLKLAEEQLAAQYSRTGGPVTACLRSTGVYGRTEPVERCKWFADACAARAGEPITRVRSGTEVHGDDLADGVWRLLTAPAERVAGRAFNCSDLLLDTRELARRLQQRTGSSARLPDAAPPPAGIMACPGLRALGWRPGGMARLDAYLDELLAALPPQSPAAPTGSE